MRSRDRERARVDEPLGDEERDFALGRVIAIVNDKGGVGKTSIAANLAGQFAAAGYRCLLIDLNRQANLADDLGYRGSDADDQGAGLLGSVLAGTPLTPSVNVRPQLDVVCGGARLEDLTPVMVSRFQHHGRTSFRVLGDVLAPIAPVYDLVFIDCPPESTILSDLALAAARWVLMPTKSDVGGLVGMTLVAERFTLAREINPRLGLLGVVLFATGWPSRLARRGSAGRGRRVGARRSCGAGLLRSGAASPARPLPARAGDGPAGWRPCRAGQPAHPAMPHPMPACRRS